MPAAVVAALTLMALNINLPYFTIEPGTARQVNDLVHVPAAQAHPPKGELLLTTVSLGQETRVIDAINGWLDPDIDVIPEERLLGSGNRRDLRRVNLQLMDDSKQVAIVVALRRLGHAVPERGEGAMVEQLYPGYPAERHFREGEVIVAVDGQPISLSQQLSAAMKDRRPGQIVRMDVIAVDGSRRVEEIALAAHPDDGRAFIGVSLRTKNLRFDLPFSVEIDSLGIGGPSAGLAYTLAVLDHLTPGELTGGRRVAVTGTIEGDGRVGDVGGVAQKTAAVRAAKADLFIVPKGELDDARDRAGKLKVVGVETLDQALAALEQIGGDVSALGTPASSRAP